MNEIRDLIVGIDFGKEYSQICYYDRKADEPRSLSMKVGSSQFEAPTCICRRIEHEDYCVGLEAEYFAREKGGVMVDRLYEICEKDAPVQVAGKSVEPWELLAHFLGGMLKFLGVTEIVKNMKCLVITAPALNKVQVANFQKACEFLGFGPEKYMLLDYGESFYYYALGQRETWNRSVAWYAFKRDEVTFRRLSLNGGKAPILVRLEEPVKTTLQGEGEERDLEFCQFIRKTLGTELYSSIQLTGTGFDTQWARESVKILCHQKRKVYYGNNLFARGACAAGKEKAEDRSLKGYRYLSDSLVMHDVGIDMRVMGSPTYYSLIEGGNNWYDCKTHCEMILDDTKELVFVVNTLGDSEKKRVAMALTGLPDRPNKTTRVSLDMQYLSPKECEIVVKDLGFGEMFPSSEKVWTELVQW